MEIAADRCYALDMRGGSIRQGDDRVVGIHLDYAQGAVGVADGLQHGRSILSSHLKPSLCL